MKAKDVTIRAYDSFHCNFCKGELTNVRHKSGKGNCFICIKCDRAENVKSVLTREYQNELRFVPARHRAKVLDMMQRDVVRWFKERNAQGYRPTRIKQTTMDMM